MKNVKMSQDELTFLITLLETLQLSGTPEQVRETLRMVDGLSKKLNVDQTMKKQA